MRHKDIILVLNEFEKKGKSILTEKQNDFIKFLKTIKSHSTENADLSNTQLFTLVNKTNEFLKSISLVKEKQNNFEKVVYELIKLIGFNMLENVSILEKNNMFTQVNFDILIELSLKEKIAFYSLQNELLFQIEKTNEESTKNSFSELRRRIIEHHIIAKKNIHNWNILCELIQNLAEFFINEIKILEFKIDTREISQCNDNLKSARNATKEYIQKLIPIPLVEHEIRKFIKDQQFQFFKESKQEHSTCNLEMKDLSSPPVPATTITG